MKNHAQVSSRPKSQARQLGRYLGLLLVLLPLVVMVPTVAQATPPAGDSTVVDLAAEADAFIASERPDQNFGAVVEPRIWLPFIAR